MFVFFSSWLLYGWNTFLLINRDQVLLLLETVDPEIVNVKWKKVSEAIVRLGGSYRFGPSTCKKKYMMLVEEGRAQPLAENPAGIKGSTIRLEIGNSRY